jgi:hypothetical protein
MGITRGDFGRMADEIEQFGDYTGVTFAAAVKLLVQHGLRSQQLPVRHCFGTESVIQQALAGEGDAPNPHQIVTDSTPSHSGDVPKSIPKQYGNGTETVLKREKPSRARAAADVAVDVDPPLSQGQLQQQQHGEPELTPQARVMGEVRAALAGNGILEELGIGDDRRGYQTLGLWLKRVEWDAERLVAVVEGAWVAAREARDPLRYMHGVFRSLRRGDDASLPVTEDWERQVKEAGG